MKPVTEAAESYAANETRDINEPERYHGLRDGFLAGHAYGYPLGAKAGYELALECDVVKGLVEALVTIECGLVTTELTAKYAGFKPKEIANMALAAFEKAKAGGAG